jgi:hypothetical protein
VAAIAIVALLIAGCAGPDATPSNPPSTLIAPAATRSATALTAATMATTATATAPATTAPTVTPGATLASALQAVDIAEVIEYEMRGAFDFFWEQANTEAGSPGYGLIRDRYPGAEGIASIASVGFGLTAYLIGVEKGYITYEEGEARASGTLDTLLGMERVEGFFYHFVSLETSRRAWDSEVSSIDTSILLMGALAAGDYFGGEVQAKAEQLYAEANWPWFLDESRQMFHMAYRPERGFEGHWDFYAEQLMLYVLAAGSDTHPVDETPYYTFTRHYAAYGSGEPFIHSWFGSLFTHQYSHAWIDFRGYTDREQVDWFDNSVAASQAQINFAIDMDEQYETLGPLAWGLTASDGPEGYNGLYGAPPSGFDNRAHVVDDTVAPAGAIGSIIFVPEAAQQAMLNYYSLDRLLGPYGLQDAYNLSRNWYAPDVIGIDKGISLLMLANYENGLIYSLTMLDENILQGLGRLQFTKVP